MYLTCERPGCGVEFWSRRRARRYCSRECANRDQQRALLDGEKDWQIMSCGAGVQSTGMLAAMTLGILKRPDVVVMVDSGWEKVATLQYLDAVIRPACQRLGVPLEVIRTPVPSVIDAATGLVLIPAYRKLAGGKRARLRTYCNQRWKVSPIKRFIRSLGARRATSWIGISADEKHRTRQPHQQWLRNRYPLVEMGISTDKCRELTKQVGWSPAPRTACVICPLQAQAEWRQMALEYPGDYQRCIGVDDHLEQTEADVYLHWSLQRLRDIVW